MLKYFEKMPKQGSLPVLKRHRQAATPEQSPHANQSEVLVLRQQLDTLQKELEQQQSNKSFVMKISNLQCTLCQRLKQQLECQEKNEKLNRKKYELRIEELQKAQKQVKIIREQDQKYNDLQNQLQQVDNYGLFNFEQPNLLTFQKLSDIDFFEKQLQQKEQSYKDLQKDYDKLMNEKTKISKEYELLSAKFRDINSQFELLKIIHDDCDKKIKEYQIKLELSLSKQDKKFDLPDSICQLKKSIDFTIQQNQVQQLTMMNKSLKDQLIQQNVKIDLKAQENQVQQHLIKIEILEYELFLSLKCCRCKDIFKETITYIPCGHSCCKSCYKPQCDYCSTETLYRNTQFDELVKIYYIVRDTKTFIKGCLLNIK
ncbi:hypothetical protein pb186bvf_006140 [Paramecium bursaria]